MAELTYSDIKEAIIEALEEHEQDNARYGNSDRRLRKENNRLTKDLLDTLKRGFKDRKSQDQDFLNKLTKKIQQNSGGRSFANEDGSFGFGTKSEKKFGQFLDKSFSRLDKGMTKLSNNIYMKIATRWNAMSNEATQQIVNAMKSFNASGISQDWDKLSYSLRDSTITMEDFVKASKEHNTAFQILNKSTKNAAGTYQGLAKSAAEFATHQGKVAYDNEQLSEAIGAYLEMQKSTGKLDKLNQKQMENGVNRLIVSADKLSKEFGLNRDELIKNSQKEQKDIDIALMNSGATPEDVEYIKSKYAALQAINPKLAEDLKNQIATFGHDATALANASYLQSSNLSLASTMAAQGRFREVADLYTNMETMQQIASKAPQGSFAGIMNMKGGEFGSGVSEIAYKAKQALQTKGAETSTDSTIIWEQRYRNEQIKKSNNEIYLMAKAAAGARAEFATLTYALQGVNAALSGAAWTKNLVNTHASWVSQILGVGGGILSVLGDAASIINLIDSFRAGKSVLNTVKVLKRTKHMKNLGLAANATKGMKGLSGLSKLGRFGRGIASGAKIFNTINRASNIAEAANSVSSVSNAASSIGRVGRVAQGVKTAGNIAKMPGWLSKASKFTKYLKFGKFLPWLGMGATILDNGIKINNAFTTGSVRDQYRAIGDAGNELAFQGAMMSGNPWAMAAGLAGWLVDGLVYQISGRGVGDWLGGWAYDLTHDSNENAIWSKAYWNGNSSSNTSNAISQSEISDSLDSAENFQQTTTQQQAEMLYYLRQIANSMNNIDTNTGNMVAYNY